MDDSHQLLQRLLIKKIRFVENYKVRALHLLDQQVHNRKAAPLAKVGPLKHRVPGVILLEISEGVHDRDHRLQVEVIQDRVLHHRSFVKLAAYLIGLSYARVFDDDRIIHLLLPLRSGKQLPQGSEELVTK